MSKKKLAYLLERYFKDSATHKEREELFRYLEEHPDNEAWEDALLKLIPQEQTKEPIDEKYGRMLRSITQKQRTVSVIKKRSVVWAAASILLILGIGLYRYTNNNVEKPTMAATQPTDIEAPEINRATVSLADGRRVVLENIADGGIVELGGVRITKLANGQIAYSHQDAGPGSATDSSEASSLNILVNPRGSKTIQMKLADGTQVWLNTGSSMTYPAAFAGNERRVELKGEAYFEVASDPTRKFLVVANGTTTEVVGTHFNVSAYENDEETKVTLLEGSVRLRLNTESLVLKPGYQGIAKRSELSLELKPNVEQVMAWKSGLFAFHDAGISEVMKAIERWYDVEVVYEGRIPQETFQGKIGRNLSLTELLDGLVTTRINYKLEGKKLMILFD